MKPNILSKMTVAGILAAVMLLLIALPALAQDPKVQVTGSPISGTGKLQLTVSDNQLYNLSNLNPGDVRTAKLTVTNNYTDCYDLYLKAKDIIPTYVNDPERPNLFDDGILQIQVMSGDDKLYPKGSNEQYGPIPGFGAGEEGIYIGRLCPGGSKDLDITVYLNGPNTGNEYQGKSAEVKWVIWAGYEWEEPKEPDKPDKPDRPDRPGRDRDRDPRPPEVEIEIPPTDPPLGPVVPVEPPLVDIEPPETPKGEPPPMPKTGEAAHSAYYLVGGLALLAGVRLRQNDKRR